MSAATAHGEIWYFLIRSLTEKRILDGDEARLLASRVAVLTGILDNKVDGTPIEDVPSVRFDTTPDAPLADKTFAAVTAAQVGTAFAMDSFNSATRAFRIYGAKPKHIGSARFEIIQELARYLEIAPDTLDKQVEGAWYVTKPNAPCYAVVAFHSIEQRRKAFFGCIGSKLKPKGVYVGDHLPTSLQDKESRLLLAHRSLHSRIPCSLRLRLSKVADTPDIGVSIRPIKGENRSWVSAFDYAEFEHTVP